MFKKLIAGVLLAAAVVCCLFAVGCDYVKHNKDSSPTTSVGTQSGGQSTEGGGAQPSDNGGTSDYTPWIK